MSEAKTSKHSGAVQTTGHSWDGNLQEFNNPLPRWWLWAFYATVVFSVIYWVLYPAWPIGDTYTKGLFNTVTYKEGGKEVTTHWNTRALLWRDMQTGPEAMKQQHYMGQVAEASYPQIISDPKMMGFVQSVGKVLFADNCAACHGSGGQGKVGLFPNLTDDAWLWGGSLQDIHTTIADGRHGFMPSFRETFNAKQLDDVVDYVLSLSGRKVDEQRAAAGKVLFQGMGGGCYACHGMDGKGMKSQGSANLTDSIWTIADVPGARTLDAQRAAVRHVILNGVQRRMPTWQGRLTATDIKVLTVYVHNVIGVGK
jgi:cytochrome c oxidase cbb3-type subunit 3